MAILLAALCAVTYGLADYCGGRASRSVASTIVTLVGQAVSLVLVVVGVLRDRYSARVGSRPVVGRRCRCRRCVRPDRLLSRRCRSGAMTVVAPITAVVSAALPVVVGLLARRAARAPRHSSASSSPASRSPWSAVRSGHGTSTPRSVSSPRRRRRSRLRFHLRRLRPNRRRQWLVATGRGTRLVGAGRCHHRRGHSTRPRCDARGDLVDRGVGRARHGGEPLLPRGEPSWPAVASSSVIASMYPVTTVCLAFGLDHERVSKTQAVGLACAATALALVSLGS